MAATGALTSKPYIVAHNCELDFIHNINNVTLKLLNINNLKVDFKMPNHLI